MIPYSQIIMEELEGSTPKEKYEYLIKLKTICKASLQLDMGYGNCPDCEWYQVPEGCNVQRDSPGCLPNKRLK